MPLAKRVIIAPFGLEVALTPDADWFIVGRWCRQ